MNTDQLVYVKFKHTDLTVTGRIIGYCESDNSCTVIWGNIRLVRVYYGTEIVEPYEYCCWPIELEEITA